MAEEDTELSDFELAVGVKPDDDGTIGSYVYRKFHDVRSNRYWDEQRWLRAYRNYRGLYGPDVQFREDEKSRIFVKVTKTKVLAAFGQIVEVMRGGNRFPLTIDATRIPEGIEEAVHFDTQAPATPEDASLFGQPLEPGDTVEDLMDRVGILNEKLQPVEDKLKPGPGTTPTTVTLYPAEISAKKMEKKIHDQLEESSGQTHLRLSNFECVLFGTGIIKGPFIVDKEYPRWNDDGEFDPQVVATPEISHVSMWDFYPDPDSHSMADAEFVIQRHRMTRSQMFDLKKRPLFRKDELMEAIKAGANYQKHWWEDNMEDGSQNDDPNRYEVLEFWGKMDKEMFDQEMVEVPEALEKKVEEGSVSVNVWVCNQKVIRFAVNPYFPDKIPYHAYPYEINPYSFFGIGIGENMDDTQTLMNGFMRMAVDNAALSGSLIFDIDSDALKNGQDMNIYPGKIFERETGAPGQAVVGIKFPNVSNENMMMFDKARQLADESTGLPSFAHGQTGVTGVGRTASGISMLMSAANGSIRTVIKNIDDYLLQPLGTAMYHFNMQFDFDKELVGDYEVKARGTESLMANEVRSQRLMQFLGLIQNPTLAPFGKLDYLIREIAKSMELDPDKVVNNMAEAAIQAEKLKMMAPAPGAPPPNPPAGVDAMDPTGSGGGSIGIGMAPPPGAPGFTGNEGGAGSVDQAADQPT